MNLNTLETAVTKHAKAHFTRVYSKKNYTAEEVAREMRAAFIKGYSVRDEAGFTPTFKELENSEDFLPKSVDPLRVATSCPSFWK